MGLGEASFSLGSSIKRDEETGLVHLSQGSYANVYWTSWDDWLKNDFNIGGGSKI